MKILLNPTQYCPASCKYCFSNEAAFTVISEKTFFYAIDYIKKIARPKEGDDKLTVTFHGGEPLAAGVEFYKHALPYIKSVFENNVNFHIQSNLWLLNRKFCSLFKKYHVGVGTSLDGPQEINDRQRNAAYFPKTLKGIELLQKFNMPVGCIATFTKKSSLSYHQVFNFFVDNSLHFSIHGAIKPFKGVNHADLYMHAEEYGHLLINLFDLYIQNIAKIKISTFDTLMKNVSRRSSSLCTFTKCLGDYIAITQNGDLYPCNRFVGDKRFILGNVNQSPDLEQIKESAAWQKLAAWQNWIDETCKDCLFKNICHGGCPYSAFSSGNGEFVKDPHCEAYQMIYNHIIENGTKEFFSEDNLNEAAMNKTVGKKSLFQKGTILTIMKDDTHPYDVNQMAKKIVTAALLGKYNSPEKTTKLLLQHKITNSYKKALTLVKNFYQRLLQSSDSLNNIYLHITGICNLNCSHCYAYAESENQTAYLSAKKIIELIENAKEQKFRKIVITGGEPLLHHEIETIINDILVLKKEYKLPMLDLRTNLIIKISNDLLHKITLAFDRIIVSIDGSEYMHNKLRGQGSYQKTIDNLRRFDKSVIEQKILFATVLDSCNSTDEIKAQKEAIHKLTKEFPVSDTRFLPVLPIGRASKVQKQRLEVDNLTVKGWMDRNYYFRTSCGIGQNLMVDSNGSTYACHVMKHKTNESLGNVNATGINDILQKQAFTDLTKHNVNNIKKCKSCDMRYLCGGMCMIWEDHDCSDLYTRAEHLLKDALSTLNVPYESFV